MDAMTADIPNGFRDIVPPSFDSRVSNPNQIADTKVTPFAKILLPDGSISTSTQTSTAHFPKAARGFLSHLKLRRENQVVEVPSAGPLLLESQCDH